MRQRPNRFLFFRSVRINILPVQPNKLETLDDLLAPAEHYAGFCMRNSGKMSPTLFLIGADGPLMFVPASLVDANEKDDFAIREEGRLILYDTKTSSVLSGYDALAICFQTEDWICREITQCSNGSFVGLIHGKVGEKLNTRRFQQSNRSNADFLLRVFGIWCICINSSMHVDSENEDFALDKCEPH